MNTRERHLSGTGSHSSLNCLPDLAIKKRQRLMPSCLRLPKPTLKHYISSCEPTVKICLPSRRVRTKKRRRSGERKQDKVLGHQMAQHQSSTARQVCNDKILPLLLALI